MALVTCPCAFRLGRLAQSMPREFVCYCSIAVPCIWYIDFLPPTLFGVSFRRIFSQQTALSVCQYTQQSLSFVVVPVRSVFVLSERAAFFNLSINISTFFFDSCRRISVLCPTRTVAICFAPAQFSNLSGVHGRQHTKMQHQFPLFFAATKTTPTTLHVLRSWFRA